MALDGHQHVLPLPVSQRAPGFLLLRLRADQRDAGVARDDPVSVSALHDRLENPDHDGDLRFAESGEGIDEHLQFIGCDGAQVAQTEGRENVLRKHGPIGAATGFGDERFLAHLVPFLGVLIERHVLPDRHALDVMLADFLFLLFEFAHRRGANIFVDGLAIPVNADVDPPAILAGFVFLSHGYTPFVLSLTVYGK